MNFTKEKIKKLADLLMIGLTEDEANMVLDEFASIDKNIAKVTEIDGLEFVDAMTHALDNFYYELRNDEVMESIDRCELLQNSKDNDGVEVILPKVVG